MKPFKISPVTKKLAVQFSNKEVSLPKNIQLKIDTYWDSLISSGKTYQRGEVFTVTKKDTTDNRIDILVEKTDYAHYLYCQNVESLDEYGVHIIHTAALVETSDGYTVFGKMGVQTARAGIYQLCGGGIDNDDLDGKYLDIKHNISKELQEELDIDVTDQSRVSHFENAYFKEGGPTDKMTAIYKVSLKETRVEFLENYKQFVENLKKNGELPEFGELITLKKNKEKLQNFFTKNDGGVDEYMEPLFEYVVEEL